MTTTLIRGRQLSHVVNRERRDLDKFHQHLNNLHSTIKFTKFQQEKVLSYIQSTENLHTRIDNLMPLYTLI